MLGDRLRLARKKAGLSMGGLVSAMGGQVSKQALSKYERNLMMPGSRVLGSLCRHLDVSLEFLMSSQIEALEGVDFRTHAKTTAKERAQVEAIVIEHAERYVAIESILGEEVIRWHAPEKRCIRKERDAESFIVELRNRWRLGIDPIPNMSALLEDLGLKVLLLDLPDRISGMTCFVHRLAGDERIPVIVANATMNLERRRLTLAHELFHRLIDVPGDADVRPERAMNYCAGAFLMPKEFLIDEFGADRARISYPELLALKHRLGVSMAALLVRLGQVGVLSEGTVGMLFRGPARPWRKHEPDPIPEDRINNPLEQPERFKRLCYRAFSEQYISRAKLMELLQLPYEQIEVALKGPSQDASHRQ